MTRANIPSSLRRRARVRGTTFACKFVGLLSCAHRRVLQRPTLVSIRPRLISSVLFLRRADSMTEPELSRHLSVSVSLAEPNFPQPQLIFLLFRSNINCDSFHTIFSRWQIPTVFDCKDRHNIRLLQTETAAFKVRRQSLAIQRLRAGAEDRTHSSERHPRTRNQSPAKRAAILRRRTW